MCLQVLHELRISPCVSQPLYWVIFWVCGSAFIMPVELLLNEQLSYWGLPVSPGTTANIGQEAGSRHHLWCTFCRCSCASQLSSFLLSESSLEACTIDRFYSASKKKPNWEECHGLCCKLSNVPRVKSPGGYVTGELVCVRIPSHRQWQPVTLVRAESSVQVIILTSKVNICDISYLNFQSQTKVLETRLHGGQVCLFIELLK